jgi:hypothetical protein
MKSIPNHVDFIKRKFNINIVIRKIIHNFFFNICFTPIRTKVSKYMGKNINELLIHVLHKFAQR